MPGFLAELNIFFKKKTTRGEEVRVRALDRKALLEALAEELPPGTVRFSSKVVSIDTERAAGDSSVTVVLGLDDGTVIRAKVHQGSVRKNSTDKKRRHGS